MSNDSTKFRSLIIYGICLPLAVFLGVLASDCVDNPRDLTTSLTIGGIVFLLAFPVFMRWYHPWLIVVWNSSLFFYFLPGQLAGWTVMAIIAFGIAIGHYILNRERRFLVAPSVTGSLIFIALVVAVTAKFRGGIGFHVLGDEAIGGKRYVLIWVAIMGYFALTSQPIEPNKRKLMTVLFFLSGVTAVISDVGGVLGGPFRWVGLFFPLGDSALDRQSPIFASQDIERFGGLANGCVAVACTFLAYYGIQQTLNLRKFWRPVAFVAVAFLSTYGGYRSLLIFLVVIFALLFYFEGLVRSRLMPVAVLGLILAGSLVVAFPRQLPETFQRSLAFLPIDVDPFIKMNAKGSSDWRIEMWQSLLPEIPNYLWLGKGLGIDQQNLASYRIFGESQVGGEVGGGLAASGDYHSGPLSLIIQFGIWGVIGFLWFLWASFRALWANYKYGDPEIKVINRFLMVYFIAKTLSFIFVFGSFYSDIEIFIGIIGFSISLNGGVAKAVPAVSAVHRPIVFNRFRPLPFPTATTRQI